VPGYISSSDQLADLCTKSHTMARLQFFISKLLMLMSLRGNVDVISKYYKVELFSYGVLVVFRFIIIV